jgi:hypothetical protein
MPRSAKEVTHQQNRHRQFMANAILIAASGGIHDMREMVAQAYASYFALADGMSRHDTLNEVITVQARTMGLLDDDGVDIWPELMPGGNQTNDMLLDIEEYIAGNSLHVERELLARALESGQLRDTNIGSEIEDYLGEGKMPSRIFELLEFGGVTTAPDHRDHADQIITHIANLEDQQVNQIRNTLNRWNEASLARSGEDNIVLEFEMNIISHRMQFPTNRAEFFKDEHGVQWVKFYPTHGEYKGGEIICTTDGLIISRINA